MKKLSVLSMLVVSLLTCSLVTAQAKSGLSLIKAKGVVNNSDIGGKGLYVYSLWDKSKEVVSQDGSFSVVIADTRPQKLSVKDDQGQTRALAIALPKAVEGVIFDAQSTALALLFQDPGLFSSSTEVEKLTGKITQDKSFQAFTAFLKKNLPLMPLEELINNEECIALLEKCNSEIFGQDQAEISKSLNEAKEKLEEIL